MTGKSRLTPAPCFRAILPETLRANFVRPNPLPADLSRRKRGSKVAATLTLTLAAAVLLAVPAATAPAGEAPGGDPARGALAIRQYGCGACHRIPGIPGARGVVGPPLDRMSERGYLGGVLANTPENLIRWLRNPPAVDPTTAMPDVGLSEAEARDMAAYLHTLK
jgi:cytochrome c2